MIATGVVLLAEDTFLTVVLDDDNGPMSGMTLEAENELGVAVQVDDHVAVSVVPEGIFLVGIEQKVMTDEEFLRSLQP